MNSPEIKQFIREHSNLFWYTPEDKKEEISHEFLVETILNYGTIDDFKKMVQIFGIKQLANIFFGAKGRKKQNYYPEIYHYFSLLFNKYA